MTINRIILSLASIIALSSCNTHVEPEDLAHSVLDAFKAKDVNVALDFILNEDDYTDFFSSSTLDDKEKERLIDKHSDPSYVLERKLRFRKRFNQIIENGEELGIVWKEVKFEYIKGPKLNKFSYGVQADEIYVFISYNSNMFKLTLDDCYHAKQGWLMSDEPRLSEVTDT